MYEVWMYGILPYIWESMKVFGTLKLSADSPLGYIAFFFSYTYNLIQRCALILNG